jgi:tetratricopeptide (TPR) repeat protein
MLEAVVRDDVDFDAGVWDRLSAVLRPEDPGLYRFRTTLVRDAAYEGLPYRRRRALHNRVGETIEANAGLSTEEELGTLALHFHEAQRWDKSWNYCRQAGDRAARIFANLDASRFYDKALRAGRRLRSVHAGELAGVYEKQADALYLLGQYQDADHALSAARRLLGLDPVETAPLTVKQAIMTSRTGRLRQTNARVTRALRSLDARRGRRATASRARLRVILGGTRHLQGHHSEAIQIARLAAREAQRSQAKDALAQAYKLLDNAYRAIGELERVVYSPRALTLYEELGDLRNQALILNNMGVFAQERSEWDQATDLYRRSLELFERIGDTANASLAKYNIAEILSDQGRLDAAEPLLRDVIRVWRASGAEADVADARRELGKLLARRGEFEAATSMFEAAIAVQRTGNQGDELATLVRMAENLTLGGAPLAALAAIAEAAELTGRTEGGGTFDPMLARLRGWALLQSGRTAEAQSLFVEALEGARRRGDVYETALLLDALVAVARWRDASSTEIQALDAERQSIVKKLGIAKMPSFPVAVAA